MSVGALVVARLGSTRLPAKNLLDLLGRPMIERLIRRIRAARGLDLVAIATSSDPIDQPLADLGARLDVPVHRGDLHNVMERIRTAAAEFGCDTVVEVLGDNPLVHSDLVEAVLERFHQEDLDYAANVTREYPDVDPRLRRFVAGVRVQAYRAELASRWSEFPEFEERDLGTSAYIYGQPDRFRCGYVEAVGPWRSLHRPELNLAVNYQPNFDFASQVFSELGGHDENFTLPEVMTLLERRPDLEALTGTP